MYISLYYEFERACSFYVSFVHEHVLCRYCIICSLAPHVWPELSPIMLNAVQFSLVFHSVS